MPSRLSSADDACAGIRALLGEAGLAAAAFRVELVARELLVNAVVHGNRRSPARRVRVRFAIGRRWLRLWVADAGPGFDWRALARRRLPGDGHVCGRGMAIVGRYADRVVHNHRGNEVTAIFRRPASRRRRTHG